jgi:tetratricopeptide (TPR) repeat protein
MTRRVNVMRTSRVLVLLAALAAVSAGQPAESPDDLIRLGNDAFDRGDYDAADRFYAAAAEHTPDPGLVAFNRATAAVRRGNTLDAEANYIRALDDRDIPPARRARALYNRGVCLMLRGQSSAAMLRSAIACFEQAADADGADAALAADARHNLELAKLLWDRARAKEHTPQRPNDLPPDVPEPPPPRGQQDPGNDPGANDVGPNGPTGGRVEPIAGAGPKGSNPRETQQKAPGAGNLPVRLDPDQADSLSTDDAKSLLRQQVERMKKARHDNARLTAGPERPHVRDW